MTDIESKLSAIKAIDNEKDYCYSCMATLQNAIPHIITIFDINYQVTPEMGRGITAILHGYYAARRMDLVSKAYALMKSEDPQP